MQVLIADDNLGDVILVREALKNSGFEFELVVQSDGESMAEYIDRIESGSVSPPNVILLDLNLPKIDGFALLDRIRHGERCKDLPVIIVTSSNSPKDREMAAKLGANVYFRKSSDIDEFMQLGSVVRDHL